MKTIAAILSNAQNDLGDIGHEQIQPAEYVDYVNTVLNEVAMQTETWIAVYSVTPITVATTTTVNSVFVPYIDNSVVPPALLSPYKLQRVIRSLNGIGSETLEFSIQSIESMQNTGYAFVNNSFQLGDYAFAAQRDGADGFVITFATPIAMNETITAEFIVGQPLLYSTWTPVAGSNPNTALMQSAVQYGMAQAPTSVPDFLVKSMQYGIIFKALQKMFLNGDDSKFQRMQWAEQLYDKAKREAAYHSRMMKNNGSVIIVQPIDWLPE